MYVETFDYTNKADHGCRLEGLKLKLWTKRIVHILICKLLLFLYLIQPPQETVYEFFF